LKPGEVIEILPDDIRPADHLARVPFAPIQEPVALLGGPGRGDVDVLGATPAASGIEVYRVHGDSEPPTVEVRNEFNVPMPDSVVGVSAAVRQPGGTTWFLDAPSWTPDGQPRIIRTPLGGSARPYGVLKGLRMGPDRVRITLLPGGIPGYVARGTAHALPGMPTSAPRLDGVQRIVPTDDGGYLAAIRSRSGDPIRIVRSGAHGDGRTLVVPQMLKPDPLRGSGGSWSRATPPGDIVALADDNRGGAYLAIASRPVDDAFGIDRDARTVLAHVTPGGTTLLANGLVGESSNCPRLPPAATLEEAERSLGRITDLLIHEDRLWIADAACARVLVLKLGASAV
jgi:hypothetical protein